MLLRAINILTACLTLTTEVFLKPLETQIYIGYNLFYWYITAQKVFNLIKNCC